MLPFQDPTPTPEPPRFEIPPGGVEQIISGALKVFWLFYDGLFEAFLPGTPDEIELAILFIGMLTPVLLLLFAWYKRRNPW